VSALERHVERELRPSKSKTRQSEMSPGSLWPRWRAGGRRAFIASYASIPTNSYLHMIHCSPTTRCACGFAEGTNKHQLRECVLLSKERAYARATARLMAQRAVEPAAANKGAVTCSARIADYHRHAAAGYRPAHGPATSSTKL
jgi:hypothetical protein